MSNNSEILTIQHLVRVAARPEVLLFQVRRLISETGISQEHVQKALQECMYINCCGIPGPLSPTPSTSSAAKSQKRKKSILITLNQQMKEISTWNTSLSTCTTLVQKK